MNFFTMVFLVLAGLTIFFDLIIFLEWFGSPKWTDGKRHLHYIAGFYLMYSVMAGVAFLLLAGISWAFEHVTWTIK